MDRPNIEEFLLAEIKTCDKWLERQRAKSVEAGEKPEDSVLVRRATIQERIVSELVRKETLKEMLFKLRHNNFRGVVLTVRSDEKYYDLDNGDEI